MRSIVLGQVGERHNYRACACRALAAHDNGLTCVLKGAGVALTILISHTSIISRRSNRPIEIALAKQGETAMPSDPGGGDPWTRFVELVPERFRSGMFRSDTALDALLACMARGWTLPELAYECTPLDAGAGAGVIVARLRDATHKRPPDPEGKAGPFTQPLPWCGQCDNGRTRWFELLDAEGKPSGSVVRCPTCWVDPPGTSRWAPRCAVCGKPTRVRDMSGRPTCAACL